MSKVLKDGTPVSKTAILIDGKKMTSTDASVMYGIELHPGANQRPYFEAEAKKRGIKYIVVDAVTGKEVFDVDSNKADRIESKESKIIVPFTINTSESISVQKTGVRKPLDKSVRGAVWRRYWSTIDGKCWVCARPVSNEEFECGHIVAVSEGGGDDILNLVPICGACNSGMRTINLIEYKNTYYPGDAYKVDSKIQPVNQIIVITKDQVIEKLKEYSQAGKDNMYFKRAIELLQDK